MTDKKQKSLNIYQRIHAIMEDVKYVQKDTQVSINSNQSYKAVSHDKVTARLREYFVKHGVVVVPTIKGHDAQWFDGQRYDKWAKKTVAVKTLKTEVNIEVVFINMDKPEEFVSTVSYGYGLDTQDKGIGKAYSYAYKYALLKIFALETGDDPENDSIDHKPDPMAVVAQNYRNLKDKMKNDIVAAEEIRFLNNFWLNGSDKLNGAHKIKMYELYEEKYDELAAYQDTDSSTELRRMDIDDKR